MNSPELFSWGFGADIDVEAKLFCVEVGWPVLAFEDCVEALEGHGSLV